MNTANKLTLLRVVMIPAFLLVLYLHVPGANYWALAIFALASITDTLDGYIARHYNQITDFGKFMDPLADKCLVTAAMLWFVEIGQMPAWALLIVIVREFAVSGLRMIAADKGRVIAAGWSGKVKTASTMVCIVLMLLPIAYWVNSICVAVIVLTTAGDDPDRKSIGWEIHEKCRRLLAWRRGEPEQPLDQDDPAWCPIMYGISILTGDDPDKIAALDIYDETLWKQCNPSYGVTIKPRQFRADARAARQSEAAERNFRWLRLNQWISTKDVGWLPLTLYDKTQIGPSAKAEREEWVRENLTGKVCYGGLDLSTTTDLTAFVLLFPPQPGLDTWVALFQAWRPQEGVLEAEQRDHVPYRDWARAGFIDLCPGDMIDYTQVEEAVAQAAETYQLELLGVDPYLSRTLTQRLTERGLTVVEIPQTMMHMSPAMKELERLIRAHEMLHVHNTCARWNFGNVRCAVDGNENMKPMKNRSIGRIDIVVAWIIVMAVAIVARNQKPDLAAAMDRPGWGM